MFKRLFGETEEEQIQFLHIRSIITIVILILIAIGFIFALAGVDGIANIFEGVGSIGIAIVMLFVWGWPVFMRASGIAGIGGILGRNVVIAVALFLICAIVAYCLGCVFAIVGTARYIYLRVKYRNHS